MPSAMLTAPNPPDNSALLVGQFQPAVPIEPNIKSVCATVRGTIHRWRALNVLLHKPTPDLVSTGLMHRSTLSITSSAWAA
jgi:hypothetical protein